MPIDPKRLMELRKRKRMSRAQLADKSRISQRQIARLESGVAAKSKARDRTVNDLAKALGVEPGVLTCEMMMPTAGVTSHDENGRSRQVSAQLLSEVSLAYALLKKRYGVSLTTLVNAAPLMFVLLAEGSFAWRREKLKEAENAAARLRDFHSAYMAFQLAAGYTEDGARFEQKSIEKRDLFGEIVRDHAWETHDLVGEGDSNPFAEYLRDLTMQIDNPEIVDIAEGSVYDRGPLKSFPEFSVCNGDVDRFTGGSAWLGLALRLGWLRVDHIPEELLAGDNVDRRKTWLEEQLEEQRKGMDLKQARDILEDFLVSRQGAPDTDAREADS